MAYATGATPDDLLLRRITDALSAVPGIHAIVLGGSRARDLATPDSDFDIGLYYDSHHPFDHAALQRAVTLLDDEADVTTIGGWGPWIDGGGWLNVGGQRVDLLYRDLHRVRHVIDDCSTGLVTAHYQPGHPHCFSSAIYLGEVACGRALWDPTHAFAALKRLTLQYPEALRDALVRTHLWEAEFALHNGETNLARADMHYTIGCAFRCIACLCQVIFALNGEHLLNEKHAVSHAGRLALTPRRLNDCVNTIYGEIGSGRLQDGLERLRHLVVETSALTRDGNT